MVGGGHFWEDFELTPYNHMSIVMVVRMLSVQYITQALLYCWFGKHRAMDKCGSDCSYQREGARTLQGEVTGKQLRLPRQLHLYPECLLSGITPWRFNILFQQGRTRQHT